MSADEIRRDTHWLLLLEYLNDASKHALEAGSGSYQEAKLDKVQHALMQAELHLRRLRKRLT